jgi:hypothetical protein
MKQNLLYKAWSDRASVRGWLKVDLDYIKKKKIIYAIITKLSFLVKKFSLYTNAFYPSPWPVTDASSIKGFILTA